MESSDSAGTAVANRPGVARTLDRTCKEPLWSQLRDDVAERIQRGEFA